MLIEFVRNRRLAYVDPRKLGRIALAESPRRFVEAHHLGPDALALDMARFRELVAGKHGAIKSWLMDQHAIAGIGNVYTDEILFQAGIHPRRSANALDRRELGRLFANLGKVLRKAIAAQADPERMPKSFLLLRRRRGALCPRCGGRVKAMAIGGRTPYYCPKCQR